MIAPKSAVRLLNVLFVGSLLGTTGCLLTQREPSPSEMSGKMTPFVGVVLMDDTSGLKASAQVIAAFWKYEEPPKEKSSGEENGKDKKEAAAFKILEGLHPLNPLYRIYDQLGPEEAGLKCKMGEQKDPKEDEEKSVYAARDVASDLGQLFAKTSPASKYISVGKVGIAPAMASSFYPLKELENHLYGALLRPGFAATPYHLKADGKGDFGGFSAGNAILAPETIGEFKVNGTVIDEGTVKGNNERKFFHIKRSEGMTLEWKTPTVPTEDYRMEVKFAAKTNTGWTILMCEGTEKDFAPNAGATSSWSIPKEAMDKMPASLIGQLQVLRARDNALKGNGLVIITKSSRNHRIFGQID